MSNKQSRSMVVVIMVFVAVITLWIGSMLVIHLAPYFGTLGERGQFGDSFGAINSLFSGLAFAGVIYAILLQREELKLQREELRLTREELARSANAHESSNQAQKIQVVRQTQTARLAAYTALLNWEMNRPKEEGIFAATPDPKEVVERIDNILDELESSRW